MTDWQDADYRAFHTALRRLAAQPGLIEILESNDTAAEAAKQLRISEEVRLEILNQLNDFRVLFRQQSETTGGAERDAVKGKSDDEGRRIEINSARTFFEEAFSQLRQAYATSRIMSVTMFIIGVVFLGIAAAGALLRPENVATNAVVGGIGIVQIVALFYRNPLADIAQAVSNAQQAKIVITSYVIGMTLIHDSIGLGAPAEEHIRNLLQVTDKALRQLQNYVEVPTKSNETTSTSAS